MQEHPLVVPGERSPAPRRRPTDSGCPVARSRSTSRLCARRNATWIWFMNRWLSLRGSPTNATPSALRGTSTPPSPDQEPPGRRARRDRASRPARRRRRTRGPRAGSGKSRSASGSAWSTSGERSAVMSWAMNWPKNGHPASTEASSSPPASSGPPSHRSAEDSEARAGSPRRPHAAARVAHPAVAAAVDRTAATARPGARQWFGVISLHPKAIGAWAIFAVSGSGWPDSERLSLTTRTRRNSRARRDHDVQRRQTDAGNQGRLLVDDRQGDRQPGRRHGRDADHRRQRGRGRARPP